MITLHIEHEISSFETWHEAFTAFAEARCHAGVQAERVSQPVGDAHYVVVALDFETVEQAEVFKTFLETQVWAVPANAPALVGSPRTLILGPPIDA